MTIGEAISIIGLILKFWDQVVWVVKRLEKTPTEKSSEIAIEVNGERISFQTTGRPKWD